MRGSGLQPASTAARFSNGRRVMAVVKDGTPAALEAMEARRV